MSERVLVLGCGAGRTGTTSLAHLLNMQVAARVTHERWSYKFHWGEPDRWFQILHDEWQRDPGGLHGDVALQWGSCMPYVINRGAKVVVMKRDLPSWLESWKHKAGRRNNWQPPGEGGTPGRSSWYHGFPKFSGCQNRKQALIRYWGHYYDHLVPEAMEQYPGQVALFYVEALGSEAGQRRILDFCGVPRGAQIVQPGGIRKNLGRHRR